MQPAPLQRRTLGPAPGSPLVAPLGLAGNYGLDAAGIERAYHELGINYFFVTMRAKTMIEGVKRLIAAGHRDDIVLCCGANMPTGGGVKSAFENACKTLGTDRIDVFQLFWVQYHWYVTGKTWPAMRELKASGKVGQLGVSIHDRPMARQLVDELGLDLLMIRYNAAHRGAEKEIFATLPKPRPAVVAYTATRWGKLLQPAKGLGPMSPEDCYRFPLSNPNVDVVLCGPKTWDELVVDAAGVAKGPLPEARLTEVRTFGDAVRATATGSFGFAGI
jgi:aryl-alcohol dehydrogenase-like predicted oxidoreductase